MPRHPAAGELADGAGGALQTPPDLSLVVVTFFSASELGRLLETFRREVTHLGLQAEVIVVDHSQDGDEAQQIRALQPEVLLERPNRGYAAGVNAGVEAAAGRVLLLGNPDLELGDDSLQPLLDGLDAGLTIVGPQFVLDPGATIFLAPPEDPSPGAEAWRAARRRWRWAWRRGLDEEIQRATGIWQASGPVEVSGLRGSLLALRRDDWDRLGAFDEGYFLYFEETDWLWRARRAGAILGIAPQARVVHRWGHSTWRHSDLESIELRSRQRFRRRQYGRWWRALLAFLEGETSPVGVDAASLGGPRELPLQPGALYVLSPFPHLMPPLGWLGDQPDRDALEALVGTWVVAEMQQMADRWRAGRAWTWQRESPASKGVRAGGVVS